MEGAALGYHLQQIIVFVVIIIICPQILSQHVILRKNNSVSTISTSIYIIQGY
jgi:hypothetical protein